MIIRHYPKTEELAWRIKHAQFGRYYAVDIGAKMSYGTTTYVVLDACPHYMVYIEHPVEDDNRIVTAEETYIVNRYGERIEENTGAGR